MLKLKLIQLRNHFEQTKSSSKRGAFCCILDINMKHIPNEIFDKAVFINEIYSIRNQNDVDKSFFVIDKINSFDVKLKQDVIKKFGSIKLLQEVPV